MLKQKCKSVRILEIIKYLYKFQERGNFSVSNIQNPELKGKFIYLYDFLQKISCFLKETNKITVS